MSGWKIAKGETAMILDAQMIYQAWRCIKINKWFDLQFEKILKIFFFIFSFCLFLSLKMSHGLRHPKIHVRFEFSSRVILIWLTVWVRVSEEPAVENVVGDVFNRRRRRRRFRRRIVAGHSLHVSTGLVVCRTTVAVRSRCHRWIELIRVFWEMFASLSRCGVELRHVEELMNSWHDSLHWTLKVVSKFL